MRNKFLSAIILVLCSYNTFAQTTIPESQKVNQEINQPLLVSPAQKKEVDKFKIAEGEIIRKHREDMRKKRTELKEKEQKLLNDVVEAKKQGELSQVQKDDFRSRHYGIKAEAQTLSQLNVDFMKRIHEQRKEFYHRINSNKS